MPMRILSSCVHCLIKDGVPSGLFFEELQDSGLYRLTCPNGHETIACLQNMKFEVLFELALHAILDGYYREAVSSFTSSMERFFEFYVKLDCSRHGVSEAATGDAWKEVASQSERQLGAFIFSYLSATGQAPKLLSKPHVELRNRVIHKGQIPTKEEAIRFGEAVAEVIGHALSDLVARDAEAIQEASKAYAFALQREAQKTGRKVSTMAVHMTLAEMLAISTTQISLPNRIEEIRKERTMMDAAFRAYGVADPAAG